MFIKKQLGQMQVGDKVKVEVESNLKLIAHDPYSCGIKVKHEFLTGWKTLGPIPRQVSRYDYFFMKQEGGREIQTLSDSFTRSGGPTVTQICIPRQMGHGYNRGNCGKFLFCQFCKGFSCK